MEEKKNSIRLNEYVENLLEQRKKEVIKEDIINEINLKKGEGLTSPTSDSTKEDTRLYMEYQIRSNVFNISKHSEERGKILKLRRFFKLKRNQQVEVFSKWGEEPLYTEGKVTAIGRDFVMLTNLKDRIWIPYRAIETANIPFGVPNYSNSHQNFMYDNDFRNRLIFTFGETVAKRDVLKQYFFEESLRTNLQSWQGTWVELLVKDGKKKTGRINSLKDKSLTLTHFRKQEYIALEDIQYMKTIRLLTILKNTLQAFVHFFKK